MGSIERLNGHSVLFVDGQPFSMLGTEIPWWHLRAGHTREDFGVDDDLYPEAQELRMKTLKVPVKWSTVRHRVCAARRLPYGSAAVLGGDRRAGKSENGEHQPGENNPKG
jgi:hypothetical protein